MASSFLWRVVLLLLTARAVSSTTGAFTEDEDNQVAMVTSHGVVTGVHEDAEDKVNNEIPDQHDLEMMMADLAGIADPEEEEAFIRDTRSTDRQKRLITSKSSLRWPKAIVPYNFNPETIRERHKKEIYAAFTRYHKYTCFRFVPWVEGTTRHQYGLPDEGHIRFSTGSGCNAALGNEHRRNGQWNSCCNRIKCTHELGHSLGLFHEHQNPLRHGVLRTEYERLSKERFHNYKTLTYRELHAWEYDITSSMHYPAIFHILYEDLRPLIKMAGQYYMYKDVSLAHDCQGLHCSDFPLTCHNDGFVTLVDDQCSCLCPAGLDPATGCTTTIQQVTTSSQWPGGDYAMLAPTEGCPGPNVFATGAWQHWGKGDNQMSGELNLGGSFTAKSFQYEFCVKTAERGSPDAPHWETGRYCILRAGGRCPRDFYPGHVQFDDAADLPGSGSGQLPDGNFTTDTRLEFCCRDDGFHSTPLSTLPNTHPFILFPNNQHRHHCQEVEGMRWTKQFVQFHSFPDLAGSGGTLPSGPSGSTLRLNFCYYVPTDYNCGGTITLSSSNPEAEITSPGFPVPYGVNRECNWLIKTEDGADKILLTVHTLKITAVGDDCPDSLEIRYNIPGQPGIRYCGDGLQRTIRSLNDTIILTLRADQHQVDSHIGFNATATLYSPARESCYDPATKGQHYRGLKNYTRGMRPCLPWSQVSHCRRHAFKNGEYGKGLDENYCRNPDGTDQPWCYTDVNGCKRDYCDVCNTERVFDTQPLCNKETVCSLSRDEITAYGCAATCNLQPPPAPVRDQTCGTPATLSDAEILETTKNGYSVGESVTYKCLTGEETSTATCLSDGQWSPLGYVCGACSPGWSLNRAACYRLFEGAEVNADTAVSVCEVHHSTLTSVKDLQEQEFVSSLRFVPYLMWVGANDREQEGTFVWPDGTPVTFTNWMKKQPNNYRNAEDCVSMDPGYQNNLWNDRSCTRSYLPSFVCKYTLSERTTCQDRPQCSRLLEKNPELCSQQPQFVQHECPFSCGVCDPDSTPKCPTASSSPQVELVNPTAVASVVRGATVTYACSAGHVLTQGQLTLACGKDGKLIGRLPVCEEADSLVQDSGQVPLVSRAHLVHNLFMHIGAGSEMTVQRSGVVKQWKTYSPQAGAAMFQVWRPDTAAGPNMFRLVGQNRVTTEGKGYEVLDVPQWDWIHVQAGDRLGVWETHEPFRARTPMDFCRSPEDMAVYGVVHSTYGHPRADHSSIVPTPFTSHSICRKISVRAVIYPLSSVPADAAIATNQMNLLARRYIGNARNTYLGESDNFRIPRDGYLSQWQFYAQSPGTAAFQVWRPRPDLGDDSFQLIGQNKYTITESGGKIYAMVVPPGERIHVLAGDITGIWYGPNRLGVPFDHCETKHFPDSDRMRKVWNVDESSLTSNSIFNITRFSWNPCYRFSFRAVISQTD